MNQSQPRRTNLLVEGHIRRINNNTLSNEISHLCVQYIFQSQTGYFFLFQQNKYTEILYIHSDYASYWLT